MAGDVSRQNGAKGGRPPGSISNSTLEKQEARDFIRKRVREALAPMVDAQILHCQGVSYMRLRNPDGSFARATDEKQIDAAIAAGASWFQIFTEAPNTQAFVALSDRAFDKPKEHMELTGEDGGPLEIISTLRSRRAKHQPE
jgi:polysaccharide pyruvyl transferase WcaK-like protein